MSELNPELAPRIVAACEENLAEVASTLGRAFDTEVQASAAETGNWDPHSSAEGFEGPGLVLLLRVGTSAVVACVPESSGVLPSWYGEGDSSSISRLKTLAQELGKLLLPEDLEVPSVSVGRVESLSEGLNRGQIAEDATTVAIPLVRGEAISAAVTLLWPVAAPEELLAGSANRAEAHTSDPSELDPNQPDSSATDPSMAQDGALEGAASKPREGAVSPPPRQRNVEGLPGFAQSLLKIRVPLEVVLARKNQSVREILELGQGTIIQFSKSCDELLDLEVDGHRIATGEVVKVGDKFGIRIVQMVLPDERFGPVRKSAS